MADFVVHHPPSFQKLWTALGNTFTLERGPRPALHTLLRRRSEVRRTTFDLSLVLLSLSVSRSPLREIQQIMYHEMSDYAGKRQKVSE